MPEVNFSFDPVSGDYRIQMLIKARGEQRFFDEIEEGLRKAAERVVLSHEPLIVQTVSTEKFQEILAKAIAAEMTKLLKKPQGETAKVELKGRE